MKPVKDIISFSSELETRMKEKLKDVNVTKDDVTVIAWTLDFLRNLLDELKVFTISYKFKSEDEEIKFFKEIKPLFYSQFLFYKDVFQLKLLMSFKDESARKSIYLAVLQRLEEFANQHVEFYEYCFGNCSHLDEEYFVRKHQVQADNLDQRFSTGFDIMLANILSHELLRGYVFDLLISHSNEQGSNLKWTGAKVDLIELLYALHATEVFNKGTADLKTIATFFENAFKVDLGNYYRVFLEIRQRKKGQTNFVDLMKSRLSVRLEEKD